MMVQHATIIHLSDPHFGEHHRFQLPEPPSGPPAKLEGLATLADSLLAHWSQRESDCPVAIVISGDFTQTADEFAKATDFVERIASSTILGQRIDQSRIFMVPGNHDVKYARPLAAERTQEYGVFLQKLRHATVDFGDPHTLTQVCNRIDDTGIVVAEINSCLYVIKGTGDELRGEVDVRTIDSLRGQLEAIDKEKLRKSIRVAVVHHHPVLLPVFGEGGRGYDSIVNGELLLRILRDFGFHLVLHGHKHYPHVFTYDPVCAWSKEADYPMVVVAGGSVGSTQLPPCPNHCNTYNELRVSWNSRADHWRVHISTFGLSVADKFGRPALPSDWRWELIRTYDRTFGVPSDIPKQRGMRISAFSPGPRGKFESNRRLEYERLRGNMPVMDIVPSLDPDQAYEVRVWIVGHKRKAQDVPTCVTWAAGEQFEMYTIARDDDEDFAATFAYWGPMLVQARMEFADGTHAEGYVYARLPGYARPDGD